MEEIKELLQKVVKDLFGVDFDVEVTVAPEGVEADYSSNVAMRLAKVLHKSPMEIAHTIETEISSSQPRSLEPAVAGLAHFEPVVTGSGHGFEPFISVSTPGFLNFILPDEYFVGKMGELGEDFEKNISCGKYSGKTVICEFSDPNPFKVLHVGHLYTSVVGDAISRLYEYAGAKVVRANFGGDVGLHVAKTLWALLRELESSFSGALRGASPSLTLSNEPSNSLTIEDIAKCYVEGTKAYEEDETAKAEIVEINKRIYEINKNDEHGNELADLYWKGRELSYQYFEDFYAKIGVKFDKYYPESTVAGRGLEKVEDGLVRGVYEMSDGAVVYRGDKVGLHTRVFINQNGLPTYEAKDVGLIFTKWDDYHFDKSVVITGNDIIEYMKVVLSSVKEMQPELVERTAHLTHGQVKLPGSVKMSSRKGNFLKAVDVLDMVTSELEESYNSKDFVVALGATKYTFLKYKMGGDIIFDPKESVKMTGNSGPYLQYSCVRAKKILSKINIGKIEDNKLDKNEKDLVKKILEYKGVLEEAVKEMAPHKVAGYLYELAQEFSRFYENCPVVGSDNEAWRGKLVEIYLKTMTHGLGILGIEIPEEM